MPRAPKDEDPTAREDRLRRQREQKRKYRLSHPEKIRECRRRYEARHSDRLKQTKAKYRSTRRAEINDSIARWKAEHPEKVKASYRRHYQKHRERLLESSRARAKRRQEDPEFRAKVAEKRAKRRRENPEQVRAGERRRYHKRKQMASVRRLMASGEFSRMVRRLLGRRVEPQERGDVEAAVAIELLEGRMTVEEIERRLGEFVAAQRGLYESRRTLSLDAIIPGTDKVAWIDRVPDGANPWA